MVLFKTQILNPLHLSLEIIFPYVCMDHILITKLFYLKS